MSLPKRFPKAEGWIHTRLTLRRGTSFTEEDVRKYLSLFGGENLEIGHIDVSRNPVIAVYRKIKPAAEIVQEHGTASLKTHL